MILQVPAELIKEAIKINTDNAAGVLVACLLIFISILCGAIIWLQLTLIKSKNNHISDFVKVINDYNNATNKQANSMEHLSSVIDNNTKSVESFKVLFEKAFEIKMKL